MKDKDINGEPNVLPISSFYHFIYCNIGCCHLQPSSLVIRPATGKGIIILWVPSTAEIPPCSSIIIFTAFKDFHPHTHCYYVMAVMCHRRCYCSFFFNQNFNKALQPEHQHIGLQPLFYNIIFGITYIKSVFDLGSKHQFVCDELPSEPQ